MSNAIQNLIQFPVREEKITLSRRELQEIVNASVSSVLSELNLKKKTRRTPEEKVRTLSPYKSNGVKKATAALPIKDVSIIKSIREFFIQKGNLREYAIFSVGLTVGIRAGDLLCLKVRDFLKEDYSFKERLDIIESKTDKRNKPLLTDYAKEAISLYLKSRGSVSLGDYLFASREFLPDGRHKPVSLNTYNRELGKAGEALGMHLSSHCMRHTFALYMNTHADSQIGKDLDYMSLMVTQMSMNHSCISQTMAYTGLTQEMMDEKRRSLSAYLLENT